jgi:hypothetical protein
MKLSINQFKTLIKNIIVSENNSRILKTDKEKRQRKTNEAAEEMGGGFSDYDSDRKEISLLLSTLIKNPSTELNSAMQKINNFSATEDDLSIVRDFINDDDIYKIFPTKTVHSIRINDISFLNNYDTIRAAKEKERALSDKFLEDYFNNK